MASSAEQSAFAHRRVRSEPADFKTANPELQETVDLLILDSIVYTTIKQLLKEANVRSWAYDDDTAAQQSLRAKSDNMIRMLESFLAIFKANHPEALVPGDIRFRLHLARFAASYARRVLVYFADGELYPEVVYPHRPNQAQFPRETLLTLRDANRDRTSRWLHCHHQDDKRSPSPERLPIMSARSVRRYAQATVDLSAEDLLEKQGVETSLMDLLPFFIRLTGARARLGQQGQQFVTNEMWLQLAAEFMLQSCISRCLLNKILTGDSNIPDVMTEAFAWGPISAERLNDNAELDEETIEENEIFYVEPSTSDQGDMSDGGDQEAELTSAPWRDIRRETLRTLVPGPYDPDSPTTVDVNFIERRKQAGMDPRSSMDVMREILAQPAHDPRVFDANLRNFLHAISESIPRPLLVQLEDASQADADGANAPPITIDGVEVDKEQARTLLKLYTAGMPQPPAQPPLGRHEYEPSVFAEMRAWKREVKMIEREKKAVTRRGMLLRKSKRNTR